MLRSRASRLLGAGVLAASVSLGVAGFTSSAGAASSITCTKLSGTISGNVTLSGCNGNTGGKSNAMPASSLASGGTVKWVNGKKTTVTLTVTSGGTLCPAGSTEETAKGHVTADTTGSATVGGKAKAIACVTGAGKISLAPGTTAKI